MRRARRSAWRRSTGRRAGSPRRWRRRGTPWSLAASPSAPPTSLADPRRRCRRNSENKSSSLSRRDLTFFCVRWIVFWNESKVHSQENKRNDKPGEKGFSLWTFKEIVKKWRTRIEKFGLWLFFSYRRKYKQIFLFINTNSVFRAHWGDGVGHRGVSEDLSACGGQYVHWARGGHARGVSCGVCHQDGQGWGSHRWEKDSNEF